MSDPVTAKRMNEQEMLACFDDAIKFGHIYVCYQPKINHTTGRMIGAEALMRWRHPVYGVQMPPDFIPVLEKNNLIFPADLYVCECTCRMLRRCIDEGIPVVPISVNMSRYDIYNHDYVEQIEAIRKKYDIPVKYLHIEITESSAIGGMELVSSVLDKFHEYGYKVEMDDFGSGYSSLNILKDLDVDVIKLDMKFLSGDIGGRGGAILSSVVQMTKWLNTPVVAEGVETYEQADYMKSIGCNYIQGYLYSKPVEEDEFIEKLKMIEHEPMKGAMDLVYSIQSGRFWDPDSMETLLFNNMVGPAAIFVYRGGKVQFIRVNDKYIKEIGMNLTAKEMLDMDLFDSLDSEGVATLKETMKRAVDTGEEQTCEVWRNVCSKICGEERVLIRSHLRMIGHAVDEYLFYATVQNITADARRYNAIAESEKRFRFAIEQANIYAWEYDIHSKDMRPCFRCMRDLGLPEVVHNYPEPVIESGLFPADYADMYRDWMKQLGDGAKYLEAVIPLTDARIPFHVRYTAEFDENGRPWKAYGSATKVVDDMEDK